MAGTTEGYGPSYISSHSADVILSDIRPTKLQIDALRSVNVLLDEFLYTILNTSRSLSTDKLRAGLLKILPTSLGKEALLEAEVELRAYWERTSPPDLANGDDKDFHLQWAFELLRLKCEAYSTLNESDEDPEAENRLQWGQSTGMLPPKASSVAPAALYLTAILEALCEHILSNVSRVAARDSSRASATVEDLFVALCEDDSIYGLFKSMKVYEQIEGLATLPKPRRSKSLSRNGDKFHISQREGTPPKDNSTSSRSHISSDSLVTMSASTISPGRRSSLDRTRAIKMFMNNRPSFDRDSWDGHSGHKKSDSVVSDAFSAFDETERSFEDAALLQEFDNLMRSDSTLKVSLTPDRLKSMDVFNKEKGQRGARRPIPKADLSAGSSEMPDVFSVVAPLPARMPVTVRPPPRVVDSIVEDEDEANPTKPKFSPTKSRQTSVTSVSAVPVPGARLRSVSASNPPSNHNSSNQHSRSNGSPLPSLPSSSISAKKRPGTAEGPSSVPTPPRTRRLVRNRESLDLDDVMAGSDNEENEAPKVFEAPSKRPPQAKPVVSARTRDLIDFLAQGPPDDPVMSPISQSGRHLTDVLVDGSSAMKANASRSSLETTKSKGSSRLQRMMAKLSMGPSSEKLRNNNNGSDDSKTFPRKMSITNPSIPTRPSLPFKRSVGNLSLANKPVPPRLPLPISPPSSPSQESLDVPATYSSPGPHSLATYRVMHTQEVKPLPEPAGPTSAPARSQANGSSHSNSSPLADAKSSVNDHANHTPVNEGMAVNQPCPVTVITKVDSSPEKAPLSSLPKSVVDLPSSKRSSIKFAAEATQTPPSPHLSADDVLAMHRLFSEATTADECRIIFDMFLARSGLPAANHDTPLPSPSDIHGTQPSKADVDLEHSLVELLLSGSEVVPPRKCRRKAVPALEDLTVEITPTPKSNGNVVTTTDIIHKDTLATSVNMQTTA